MMEKDFGFISKDVLIDWNMYIPIGIDWEYDF